MTLRWPTLPWQPNYRATATTRRNMRTRRPSTGEAPDLMGWFSSEPKSSFKISEMKHQVNLVNSLDVWVKVLKVDWRPRTDECFINTTELVWIWCHFGIKFFIFCTKLIPSSVLIWIWCTSAMPRKLKTWQPRLSTGLSSTSIPLCLQTWTSPGLRGSMDSRVMWESYNFLYATEKKRIRQLKKNLTCLYLEAVQVRPELDEGRRLGGFKIPGRPAGKESWGARQWGKPCPRMHHWGIKYLLKLPNCNYTGA